MLVQGDPVYAENNKMTVTNPRLIVEILSKSTKNYDRGDKFTYYRSIPELQEYVLIDQYSYHVMQYVKTDARQWLLTDYTQSEDILKFGSIDYSLSMNEIYDRVNFADVEE
jgi:Uma2 family endonuclease